MKKENFKIPENYFDNLSDRIIDKHGFDQKEVFKVEDHYFDKLERRLLEELPKKKKVIPFPIGLRIAAALLIGLLLIPFDQNESRTETIYNEEVITEFIDFDLFNIDQERLLEDALNLNQLDPMDFITDIDQGEIQTYFNDEEFEYYDYEY
ncbi:hypothetical protein N9L20_06665 [Flavobacteriaceae bacterium]|nr:hypothetical protein [Flavobacteriaceae bacterium]